MSAPEQMENGDLSVVEWPPSGGVVVRREGETVSDDRYIFVRFESTPRARILEVFYDHPPRSYPVYHGPAPDPRLAWPFFPGTVLPPAKKTPSPAA